jgi:Zn-dependent peptidase ImmA (M78 family)
VQRPLVFNRLAIEEDGPNPEKLAQAVHKQLGASTKAVPIIEVALALDITEIRYEPLESFEGALLTTPERDIGSILVNEASGHERRRFTIAHELGHYLNVWHTPTSEAGFMCAKRDMGVGQFIIKPGLTVHERQELQANQFAIELLAPRKQVEHLTSDEPSLAEALAIGDRFELSKAAATRRYVELHHRPVAIVYTQQGKVNFHISSKSCPTLQLRKNDSLIRPHSLSQDKIWEHELDVAVRRGTGPTTEITVVAHTLFQQKGFAVTLLAFDSDEDED